MVGCAARLARAMSGRGLTACCIEKRGRSVVYVLTSNLKSGDRGLYQAGKNVGVL
jgi:hypothetical protein